MVKASSRAPSRPAAFSGAYFAPPTKRRRHSVDGNQSFSKSRREPVAKRKLDGERRAILSKYNAGGLSWFGEKAEATALSITERKLTTPSVNSQREKVRASVDTENTICGFRLVDMTSTKSGSGFSSTEITASGIALRLSEKEMKAIDTCPKLFVVHDNRH